MLSFFIFFVPCKYSYVLVIGALPWNKAGQDQSACNFWTVCLAHRYFTFLKMATQFSKSRPDHGLAFLTYGSPLILMQVCLISKVERVCSVYDNEYKLSKLSLPAGKVNKNVKIESFIFIGTPLLSRQANISSKLVLIKSHELYEVAVGMLRYV